MPKFGLISLMQGREGNRLKKDRRQPSESVLRSDTVRAFTAGLKAPISLHVVIHVPHSLLPDTYPSPDVKLQFRLMKF